MTTHSRLILYKWKGSQTVNTMRYPFHITTPSVCTTFFFPSINTVTSSFKNRRRARSHYFPFETRKKEPQSPPSQLESPSSYFSFPSLSGLGPPSTRSASSSQDIVPVLDLLPTAWPVACMAGSPRSCGSSHSCSVMMFGWTTVASLVKMLGSAGNWSLCVGVD